jgi:Asp-tRNA(Asn)/Glu-tRNA(Gln) amidotransferase A subunit family amidase
MVSSVEVVVTGLHGWPPRLMWFEFGTVNLGNLTGYPALSLPCGFTPDGMPVSLQLFGRPSTRRAFSLSATVTSRRPAGTIAAPAFA